MADFTNDTKNSSTLSGAAKNSATFKNSLSHGRNTKLEALKDFTFTAAPYYEDEVAVKDKKFTDLVDATWAGVTKN